MLGITIYMRLIVNKGFKKAMQGLMKNLFTTFLVFLFFGCSSVASESISYSPEVCGGKIVLGRIEKVTLVEKNLNIDAKLDTGATMASLSAIDVQKFRNKGIVWVSFVLFLPTEHKKVKFSAQLARYVRIRTRNEESMNRDTSTSYTMRPVIRLTIRIGNKPESILVNLVDRTNFDYPLLLGSDALQKLNVLVDVSQTHLSK